MSTLIVLGNTNQYTFANSIIAANAKSIELFGEPARDICVIHSNESSQTLNTETGWSDHLEKNHVSPKDLTSKIIDLDSTQKSVENFVRHIETIINGFLSKNQNVIVDLTNSVTLYKNLLSAAAYTLDLQHQYVIDIRKISKLTNERGFLQLDILRNAYIPASDTTLLDNIAYLSLVEIVRYKRIIQEHTEKYVQIGAPHSNKELFEKNLVESVRIKMQGDQRKENAIYRIAASSIPASVEDLISILIDQFLPADNSQKGNKGIFGYKLNRVYSEMQKQAPADFDFDFLKRFNDFMLYLRNSSVHKDTALTDIDKFKADLSIKMSFPFIEFYMDIIYPLLANSSKKPRKLSATDIKPGDVFYFALNCTGATLEDLFSSASDEAAFNRLNNPVTTAINEIKAFIKSHTGEDAVIFAAGDDMLFKANFDESLLRQMQQIYSSMTSGATCSIGYGKTFREVYLALKLAKKEPGDNSIVGIELV